MEQQSPEEAERRVVTDDYYGYQMPIPSTFFPSLFATEEAKWNVLKQLGITKEHGSTPLIAWRNAVADETGVERDSLDPKKGGALDLNFSPSYVRKFVFFLA